MQQSNYTKYKRVWDKKIKRNVIQEDIDRNIYCRKSTK